MKRISILTLAMMLLSLFAISYSVADRVNAEDTNTYVVLNRGDAVITIDANLGDWAMAENVLFMGEGAWEPLGGTWDGPADLSAELKVIYDANNLYFALLVMDDEYVAQGAAANHWENDGAQMAIDTTAGKIPAGWPNETTHLYNFSILGGWGKETGPFLGDAEIKMARDDSKKQTIFEWRMPVGIIAKAGTELKAGMEIAFAIITNDSDNNAPGQTGWIGWGNHTIVYGKNPEEMKTLVLSDKTISEPSAVSSDGKVIATWGELKR